MARGGAGVEGGCRYQESLNGSFFAVLKPMFARKHSLEFGLVGKLSTRSTRFTYFCNSDLIISAKFVLKMHFPDCFNRF